LLVQHRLGDERISIGLKPGPDRTGPDRTGRVWLVWSGYGSFMTTYVSRRAGELGFDAARAVRLQQRVLLGVMTECRSSLGAPVRWSLTCVRDTYRSAGLALTRDSVFHLLSCS
jgi:hypothetical protein